MQAAHTLHSQQGTSTSTNDAHAGVNGAARRRGGAQQALLLHVRGAARGPLPESCCSKKTCVLLGCVRDAALAAPPNSRENSKHNARAYAAALWRLAAPLMAGAATAHVPPEPGPGPGLARECCTPMRKACILLLPLVRRCRPPRCSSQQRATHGTSCGPATPTNQPAARAAPLLLRRVQ